MQSPRLDLRLCLLAVLLLGGRSAWGEVEITAEGASGALLDNLRAHLPLTQEPCDAPLWRIRRRLKRVPQTLDPALRAFGYYGSRIETELKPDAETPEDCWLAEIRVTLGTAVKVRKVDIEIQGEGADTPPFERIRTRPPLTSGEQLRHDRYEAIKTELRNTALEYGYFDAELERRELRVDPEAGHADIRLSFDTGPRYRIGALSFSEQPLDEEFVRRLGAVQPGAPYSARDLASLDRHLSDSGYYSRVDVLPRREQAGQPPDGEGDGREVPGDGRDVPGDGRDVPGDGREVPIDVKLTPKPRHAWRFGIGFETDTGPRFSAGYDNRYVNRRGHQFGADLRLSPVLSELTGRYTIPGWEPHKENYIISGGIRYEDTDGTRSDAAELSVRQVLRRDGWTETRFVDLLHERSEIGDETTRATLLMPGIAWDRVQADDPLRTERGYRLRFEAKAAHEALLSSATLLRLEARGKGIYRIPSAGRFTGRLALGATLTDQFSDLPSSLRFYAGGDNSVRGYGYKRLSPRNADGEPVGGRYLLVGSIEYEHPLDEDENWWGAAFVDAGNAFDTEDFDVKVGYGVGLRWYSPIGRVRFDFALPQDTADDDYRIHLGFGADL